MKYARAKQAAQRKAVLALPNREPLLLKARKASAGERRRRRREKMAESYGMP